MLPGTQACTMDIAKFHRTCPVLPLHKPWLVVQGTPGQFFINHAHPFGAACASSNAGMIANAIVDIWEGEGVFLVPKYEDNLKVFRIPSASGTFIKGDFCYDYDHAKILCCIESFGVPWHEEKGDDNVTFITTFISFQWDIPQKLVSLPEAKQLKFHKCVHRFLNNFSENNHPCQLINVEKLHRSLCHVAFVYTNGHSHFPSLSNFAASFHSKDRNFITQYPPRAMIKDLKWWLKELSSPCLAHQLHPHGPLQDLSLFVDASTSWGISIVMGASWAAFHLSPTWKIPGQDICWLETVTIGLLIYLLEQNRLCNCQLLIHSNNQGTIGAMSKGHSSNTHINLTIHQTYMALMDLFITPDITYIKSEANLADPILCGEPGPVGKCVFPSFKLPDKLINCFIDV